MPASLKQLQSVCQQTAELIASVLRVDVAVVAGDGTIVAGCGAIQMRIGQIASDDLYVRCLRSGLPTIAQLAADSAGPLIVYPVQSGSRTVGSVGITAEAQAHRQILLQNAENTMALLQRMAGLIAAKAAEIVESTSEVPADVRLHAVLDAVSEGVLILDPSRRIEHCNRTAAELLRLEVDSTGHTLASVLPPLEKLLPHGSAPEQELSFKHNGYRFHLLCSLRPIATGRVPVGSILLVQETSRTKGLVSRFTTSEEPFQLSQILGSSPQLQAVKEIAGKVAQSGASVLLAGESGTGKELFARAIHSASPRSKGPFIAVNCGAIPETLMESELFGYVEGAFTGASKKGKPGKFELASGGTIFLDEVGDLPLQLQVKLLRVLEEREVERVGGTQPLPVDIRVIAATNRNLEEMMQQGHFREDLYYRLAVIPLTLPPLRERTGDILEILQVLLDRCARDRGKQLSGFSAEALQLLTVYQWPGNVREMQNTVDYAVTMATGSQVETAHLPPRLRQRSLEIVEANAIQIIPLAEAESQLIRRALAVYGNTGAGKRQAAQALGIDLGTLYRKLKIYAQTAD